MTVHAGSIGSLPIIRLSLVHAQSVRLVLPSGLCGRDALGQYSATAIMESSVMRASARMWFVLLDGNPSRGRRSAVLLWLDAGGGRLPLVRPGSFPFFPLPF